MRLNHHENVLFQIYQNQQHQMYRIRMFRWKNVYFMRIKTNRNRLRLCDLLLLLLLLTRSQLFSLNKKNLNPVQQQFNKFSFSSSYLRVCFRCSSFFCVCVWLYLVVCIYSMFIWLVKSPKKNTRFWKDKSTKNFSFLFFFVEDKVEVTSMDRCNRNVNIIYQCSNHWRHWHSE